MRILCGNDTCMESLSAPTASYRIGTNYTRTTYFCEKCGGGERRGEDLETEYWAWLKHAQ